MCTHRSRTVILHTHQAQPICSLSSSHSLQYSRVPMCSARPSGWRIQGNTCHGGSCRTCCAWPHSSSAIHSSSASWRKPTIRRSITSVGFLPSFSRGLHDKHAGQHQKPTDHGRERTDSPNSATAATTVTSGSIYRNAATCEASIRSRARVPEEVAQPGAADAQKDDGDQAVAEQPRQLAPAGRATKKGRSMSEPASMAPAVGLECAHPFEGVRPRMV